MIATERLYPIRRPLAALLAGASVALLGGLIGLGGAEFRLPLLIAVFALYPHRAIRINLLISLATLAMSAAARLGLLGADLRRPPLQMPYDWHWQLFWPRRRTSSGRGIPDLRIISTDLMPGIEGAADEVPQSRELGARAAPNP
jgi:hypothetical protein